MNFPILCLGTFQFSSKWNNSFKKKELIRCLEICNKNKNRFVDTADQYEDGNIEKVIGNFLENKKREDWIIATKFGQLNGFGFNKISENLENSLKRLKSNYIDIYYFHSGTRKQFLNPKLWMFLNSKVKDGIIKYLGYSISYKELQNFNKLDFKYFQRFNIKVLQVVYNPLFPLAEHKIFNLAKKYKIKIVVRGTLAKGILASRNFDFLNTSKKKIKFKKINLSQKKIQKATKYLNKNESPIKLTFKKILRKRIITSMIVGVNNEQQFNQNLKYVK